MATCVWGYGYYPQNKRFLFEEADLKTVVVAFSTTNSVESSSSTLIESIDEVYDECINDGWAVENNLIAKGIKTFSYHQAKIFAKYIENMILPDVVPCYDGLLGFSWNLEQIAISIVFRENNQFTYSIVKKDSNHYGIITQTDGEQRHFVKRIIEELNEFI